MPTERDVVDLIAIAGIVATFGGWVLYLIQLARLPWHIRWDIKPYPSPFKIQFASVHPEWLDAKGLAIRRSMRRFLIVAAIGLMVVLMATMARMYVDV